MPGHTVSMLNVQITMGYSLPRSAAVTIHRYILITSSQPQNLRSASVWSARMVMRVRLSTVSFLFFPAY